MLDNEEIRCERVVGIQLQQEKIQYLVLCKIGDYSSRSIKEEKFI
jgi:hypothetical protein